MIRKFILVVFCLLISHSAFAIDWISVEAPNGSNAFLDKDSIKEYKRFIFYNIKVYNKHTHKNVVITMQSNFKNGLTARIKYYSEEDYTLLNGDYDNIVNNITKTFEPVQYGSIAYSCYLKAKSIIEKDRIQILL